VSGDHPNLLAFLKASVSRELQTLREAAADRLEKQLTAEEIPYTRNHYLYEVISKKRNEGLRRRVVQTVRGMRDPTAAAAAVEALFEANERTGCERQAVIDIQVSRQASSNPSVWLSVCPDDLWLSDSPRGHYCYPVSQN
jgi:hypothetical protein